MKNYIKFYFIVCCTVLFSCKDKRNTEVIFGNTETVSLDMKDKSQSIEITDLADSVRYVKLETTDESMIGEITQVIFHDGLFYIKDTKTASVLVFDKTGKYKFNISKKGRGPGEYVEITRMMIDRKNGQIILYDIHTRKIVYYTLTGKFVKEIRSFSENATIRDIILLPDGGFLCYDPYNDGKGFKPDMKYWGVWKVDSLGKYDKHVWSTANTYPAQFHWEALYFYELADNKIGLWCADIDDIFHFSNDTIIYRLSTKINQPTGSDFPGQALGDIPQNITIRTDIFESDNFIYTQWWDKSKNYADIVTLYFKKEKKSLVTSGIRHPKDCGFLNGRLVSFNHTDQMLQVISGYDASSMLDAKDYLGDNDKALLKSLFSNPEEDNPVLAILYLKK
ncbi:MAG: 6-bladed beta-propeller [Prevotellaceae bacterium]|jgi:hypothetical protein|nr:6-bladed beta-propeller [Prevotellaceae bacterium]